MVMEGTKKKRLKLSKKKAQKRDRLTELPEPLLHHILSYLSMEDVIRTSFLAKRWRYIWSSVHCLNFTLMKRPRYRGVAFINQSLLLYKGPKIQKLNISFKNSNGADELLVDWWIHFASIRNVEELSLDFLHSDSRSFRLPHFLFSCRSLTVLTLKRCHIISSVNFKLSSLKILSLEQVVWYGGAINDLISSSPIIEYLSLTNCKMHGNLDLDIMNAGLKTLKIHESDQCSSSSNLEVYAPFVISFELITSMSRKNYVIKGMQSLESASFDCSESDSCCGHLYIEGKGIIIVKILDNIRHVKDLRLGSCCIQALSIVELQNLDSLSFDVTCLRIKTGLKNWELPGIAYMLRHSPNIETLIITIEKTEETAKLNDKSNCKFNFEDGEYWKLQEPNFIYKLWNLKTVKIHNFMKNLNILQSKRTSTKTEEFLKQLQNDRNFLRFLLKNSKVLERMTISTCSKNVNFGKSESKKLKLLFMLTQELLSFPRAPRDAEISFS